MVRDITQGIRGQILLKEFVPRLKCIFYLQHQVGLGPTICHESKNDLLLINSGPD